MASILLVTSEMAGRLNIMCELARRLDAAGHTATVTCPVDVRSRIEAQNVGYVDIAADPEPAKEQPPRGPTSLPARAAGFVYRLSDLRTVESRRREKVDDVGLIRFEAALTALNPDLVLIDVELPAHVMASYGAGANVALWTSMLSQWKRPGLPPLGSSTVVGQGFAGSRLGVELTWARFRLGKWLQRQRYRITRVGEDRLSVLRMVAADTGFPIDAELDVDQWLVPGVFHSVPTVSFNAFELEFPHDPVPSLTYAGPVLADGARGHPGVDRDAIQKRLDALVARRRSGESAALIYCSFGAWHRGDDRSFLGRILRAVERHPEWDAIVGLGGRLDPESLGTVPANMHIFAWAPQLEVLRHADAAVHHGGISTVNECVVNGVPMVVYPFDFMDQPGNAARVAYHRIGEFGDRENDTADAIAERIERLLDNPEITERMAQMQRAFARYEREQTAIGFVEERLRS